MLMPTTKSAPSLPRMASAFSLMGGELKVEPTSLLYGAMSSGP